MIICCCDRLVLGWLKSFALLAYFVDIQCSSTTVLYALNINKIYSTNRALRIFYGDVGSEYKIFYGLKVVKLKGVLGAAYAFFYAYGDWGLDWVEWFVCWNC